MSEHNATDLHAHPSPSATQRELPALSPTIGVGTPASVGAGAARAEHDGRFVRPATPRDCAALGECHAQAMLASLEAAYQHAHGTELPAGVRAMVSAQVIATGWEATLSAPQSRGEQTFVATETAVTRGSQTPAQTEAENPEQAQKLADAMMPAEVETTAGAERVVGVMSVALSHLQSIADDSPASAPTEADAHTADQAPDPLALEVTALAVSPQAQRRGHASRLMAAAVDHARTLGATVLIMWALDGDESLAAFLSSTSMAPVGGWRRVGVGEGLRESCWMAVIPALP